MRDIGVVAAKAMIESGHCNKSYSLTGNEALTYFEVAEIMTKEINEQIKYANPSVFSFWRK